MNNEIGWQFPPTGGGETDGWNHPGIGHFRGTPFESVARETIQNSLDAVLDPGQPVDVVFELVDLTSGDFGGLELAETVSACLDAVRDKDDEDDPALPALVDAMKIIGPGKVPCLRISDRNTTGLSGLHWQTLAGC